MDNILFLPLSVCIYKMQNFPLMTGHLNSSLLRICCRQTAFMWICLIDQLMHCNCKDFSIYPLYLVFLLSLAVKSFPLELPTFFPSSYFFFWGSWIHTWHCEHLSFSNFKSHFKSYWVLPLPDRLGQPCYIPSGELVNLFALRDSCQVEGAECTSRLTLEITLLQ